RGFDVAVNYASDTASAGAVVADIKAAGRKAFAVQADMAREDDIARMFATVDRDLGPLTHFLYNCGITGAYSRLEAVDPAVMRRVLEVNVLGALLCVRHAITRMSTHHGGRGGSIVLLSSAAATIGSAGEYVWYAASKGAIDSMTLGIAR